jgi:hypothetical protein
MQNHKKKIELKRSGVIISSLLFFFFLLENQEVFFRVPIAHTNTYTSNVSLTSDLIIASLYANTVAWMDARVTPANTPLVETRSTHTSSNWHIDWANLHSLNFFSNDVAVRA